MDSALDSDSKGRWFESSRAHQKAVAKMLSRPFFFVILLKIGTHVVGFSGRRILKAKKRCAQRAHLFGINKYPQLGVKHLQVS